jgi:pyruvate, water dikinase
MARADRKQEDFTTGLSGLDEVLNGVRAGDNIVWQVDSPADYVPFVHPFCRAAVRSNRKLIYFRFAGHEYLIPPDVEAEVYHLKPQEGFEGFLDTIFSVIEKFGVGACYVFDCLSELTADWYSDRMLGNFFRLTCPYLYDYETATYFALLKDHHTEHAVSAIHGTAQVVIDVFRRQEGLYVHPLKVFKRRSETMYMLHAWEAGDRFAPVRQSATIAEVLSAAPQPWLDLSGHRFDAWTRAFAEARDANGGSGVPAMGAAGEELKSRLIRMAVTRDSRFGALADKYFTLNNLVEIGKRMIGTGLIGGKSAGMLIAHAILAKDNPEIAGRLGVNDSFYVGSDAFYTYLILNGCWWVRRRLKGGEAVGETSQEARRRMLSGAFPEDIRAQFAQMLNYFGQSPIIVRSSSLLEDAYGNAFSGKYESVFCANQGTPQDRLDNLLEAVRKVYASTMSRDALAYRAHWGLLEHDEQMALLIQRVSGSWYGQHFFPQAAGVAFSFNPFVWNPDIDPNAGVVRLVFGLGTRAVDRSDDDYTRVVPLNAPQCRPETPQDLRKYTQRKVDVLDLQENRLVTRELQDVVKESESELPLDVYAPRDAEIERWARENNRAGVFSRLLTFEPFLGGTSFAADMRGILRTLHDAYHHAVDVEFTANLANDRLKINVVQCRPFQLKAGRARTRVQTEGRREVLLQSEGPVIGNGMVAPVDRLIYVVPAVYSGMNMADRYGVARLIGRLAHLDSSRGKVLMLAGPGRWGTSTPALGVPVTFAEIDTVAVLCEIAVVLEGLIPDVSLGTHFFNDLVEMDALYLAVFPERAGGVHAGKWLETAPSRLLELMPGEAQWDHAVRVIDSPGADGLSIVLDADPVKQKMVCYAGRVSR